MTQLYSVHLKRKVLVYSGPRLEHVEERLVDEVYHDLPMKTCQAYREKFGDQVVSIYPTPASARDTRRHEGRAERRTEERSGRRAPKSAGSRKPASAPVGTTYADAINEHMRRTA